MCVCVGGFQGRARPPVPHLSWVPGFLSDKEASEPGVGACWGSKKAGETRPPPRRTDALSAPSLRGAQCTERAAQALLSRKRHRVAGQPPTHQCVTPHPPHPREAPLPGVRRNRGIQTVGRTWRAPPGAGGRGRRGLARGGRRGAATAPGPPAPRRWEGEAEERVNSSTCPANFSNPVGKGAAAAAASLLASHSRASRGLWDQLTSQRRHKYIFCKKGKKKKNRVARTRQVRCAWL